MSGLVLELQRDALDKNIAESSLLRKAIVVSKKLGITEIETWINQELAGYPADEDIVPAYREVSGVVRVFNRYHGWRPLNFGNAEVGEKLSKRKISQAIGELVAIAESDNSGNLHVPFSQHTKNLLMKTMDIPLEPILLVGGSQIHGILEAVRNEILNWGLDLETKGIIGDGMTFSTEEKVLASQVTYNVTNYIGSMQNSQLQQDSAGASQTQNITQPELDISAFIEELKASIHDLDLNQDDSAELEAEVLTVELQLASPKPKSIIVKE